MMQLELVLGLSAWRQTDGCVYNSSVYDLTGFLLRLSSSYPLPQCKGRTTLVFQTAGAAA